MSVNITLIPKSEFDRVKAAPMDRYARLELLAAMTRANTIAMVKRAGSGHLGSSFSAMDIFTYLYHEVMNVNRVGLTSHDRDIYFSSKGHDAPGFYSTLYSVGIVPEEKLLKLRRHGGLDGHPDTKVPGVEFNTGSLGMGISKARGVAWAKRFHGWGGRVMVMTGDGELQEGQNFEALQSAVALKLFSVTVIVDHNKLQSDKLIAQIVDLGELDKKFRAFGWYVARCDGHDYRALEKAFAELDSVKDKPKVLILDTIKGRGVSFMEHPRALQESHGSYKFHAGAPNDALFTSAYGELIDSVQAKFAEARLGKAELKAVEPENAPASGVTPEFVIDAYGAALVEAGKRRKDLVVLDGDLALDNRVRDFENTLSDRFIENGIAEQDMTSMAGALARHGFLPVVNSFSSFLAARANEQIYNNGSEHSKIIYCANYAGLIPAGPGKSHQSIRDIALLGNLPNVTILEPANAEETGWLVDWCVDDAKENCWLRLVIGPSPRRIELPKGYKPVFGQGVTLKAGKDAVMFAYGPVMLNEALRAGELLEKDGFGLEVISMPWLNRFDGAWLKKAIAAHRTVLVLEDHGPVGGLGDRLLAHLNEVDGLAGKHLRIFGVEGYPACGTPLQALAFHRLDGATLATRAREAAAWK